MKRLGYTRYLAQGGDWGAGVVEKMGRQAPAGLLGIHTNLPAVFPPDAAEAIASGGAPPGGASPQGAGGVGGARSGEATPGLPLTPKLACPLFFFNDTATTEIYTLSLHDALPI